MEKKVILPAGISQPLSSYSQALEVRAQRLLFISGQVPCDNGGNLVGKDDITVQTTQVFSNLKQILEAAGGSLDNVVKLTIFMTDIRDFQKVCEVRSRFLNSEFPTCSLIEVKSLVKEDWLVEIEAIAAFDS